MMTGANPASPTDNSGITCPQCFRSLATRPAGTWLIAHDLGRGGIEYRGGVLRLRCATCREWGERTITLRPVAPTACRLKIKTTTIDYHTINLNGVTPS